MAKLLLLGALALGMVLAACGDDDDAGPTQAPVASSSPTPGDSATISASADATPARTPTPAGTPTPRTGVSTGVASVDQFVKALFNKDVKQVIALIDYQDVKCTTKPQGIGAPPTCPAGEPDGSLVKAIPASVCEGYYVVAATAEQEFGNSVAQAAEVFAISRAAFDRYAVVIRLTPTNPIGFTPGVMFTLSDEGVVGVTHGCATSVRALASRNTDYLVKPLPLPPPPADTPKTGIKAVDDVINALVVGDVESLVGLTKVSKAGCDFSGTKPRCADGMAPGTPLDAVEVRTCQSFFFSPDGLPEDYDLRFGSSPKVTAVAKGTGEIAYWVIVNVASAPVQDPSGGRALGIDASGKIAVIDGGCSESAAKIAARFKEFVLPPK